MADNEPDPLSQRRTDLAEERTVLANERTYAGWVRTGFAAIGVGLGFHALFDKIRPDWIPKAISTLFLLIAIFILFAAEIGSRRVKRKVHGAWMDELPPVNLTLVTAGSVFAAIILIAATWLLDIGTARG